MPTDTVCAVPWHGKEFRCFACGSTQTMTIKDRVHADMSNAERLIGISGEHMGYVGFVVFWSPCPSCSYQVEWVQSV